MKHVIVGNGVAGINAANTIRSRDDDAEIGIVSNESDHFFSRTAMMYVACGQLSEVCVEPYERDYYERMRFNRIRDTVLCVDSGNRVLKLAKSPDLPFDRLLIASGSKAVPPPWPGKDLDGVGHFVSWQNLEWLREKMKTARKAVVIGGGLVGIEVVEVLLAAMIPTTFVIREESFWPIALSTEESDVIVPHMRSHGCDVRLATEMEEILGRGGKVSGIRTRSGEVIDCDLVVVTIGVMPQTAFLKDSGVTLDERGGIVVDEHLATSVPDVWAAGDCTSVVWFNGVRRPEQLWYTSRDQGRVAGFNMSGDQRVYKRGTFYNSAKFFDIEYTTAGLVNFRVEGEQNWYQREPGTPFTERITYLPDETVIGFNMLGRRWDHRILVRWLEEKRSLGWIKKNLDRARFDEEFMPKLRLVDQAG